MEPNTHLHPLKKQQELGPESELQFLKGISSENTFVLLFHPKHH
jgi:hypothetical protein